MEKKIKSPIERGEYVIYDDIVDVKVKDKEISKTVFVVNFHKDGIEDLEPQRAFEKLSDAEEWVNRQVSKPTIF